MEAADHKYDTTLGRLDVHTCMWGGACRVASPLADRVLGLQPSLSVQPMMDSRASLFQPGFVCRLELKAKNKRAGRGRSSILFLLQ